MQGRSLFSSPNSRFTVETLEGVSRLSVSNISADDSGKYIVVVSNEHGNDSYFASVAVEGKCAFTTFKLVAFGLIISCVYFGITGQCEGYNSWSNDMLPNDQ